MNIASNSAYRPEIDGLRALAILPVLLFHFDIPGFEGGFVGVDVFFVISGYLISKILWVELSDTGGIKIGHFFLRRIRRLGPAYFSMAVFSLIASWYLLMPQDFREFGKELIASTVYLSNVHFFRESGYFDGLAESKVLLHTWSLSVEEQFYIFLPLFMLVFRRFRQFLAYSFPVLLMLSFVGCIWMTYQSQPAAFYLFPFRAWEMLAGVSLGVLGYVYSFRWSIHPILSWMSIVLMISSVAFISSGEHFPGFIALIPVLSASLMLANGKNDNFINRFLSISFLRFFGLISYSLYLWHWPIATLSKYYFDGELSWPLKIFFILLSILIAWISWKFIETPVRKGVLKDKALFIFMVICSIGTLSIGSYIYLKDGVMSRFDSEIQTHVKASLDFNQDFSRCYIPQDGPLKGIEICPLGPDGEPKILIWGDSHGRAFKEGLEKLAFEKNVPALLIWKGGCPPLAGIQKKESVSTRINDQKCNDENTQISEALKEMTSVQSILLIGRWTYYTEGKGVGNDAEITIDILPDDTASPESNSQIDILQKAWIQNLTAYRQNIPSVYVLEQPPEIFNYRSGDVARKIAHGHIQSDTDIAELSTTLRSDLSERNVNSKRILNDIEQKGLAKIIRSWRNFCDDEKCYATMDNTGLYFDNNHITTSAAIRFRKIFEPAFDAAIPQYGN